MPYVNKIRTGGETYTINALPNQDTQDGKFLSTDGLESYWAELPIMEGASSEEEGSGGLVPAPNAGDEDKYLAGDATWKTVIDSVPDMTAPSDGEAGVHGLVPAPGINDGSKYLRGNGTWGEINEMVGAQDDADGSHGLVPAPTAGSQEKYLAGDATWKQLPALAVGTSGMVSGPTEEDSEKFLSGNASWTSFDDDFDTNFSSSTPLINGKASLAIKNWGQFTLALNAWSSTPSYTADIKASREDLGVTINISTFMTLITELRFHVFTYDTESYETDTWTYVISGTPQPVSLGDYGITITSGAPQNGDTITVNLSGYYTQRINITDMRAIYNPTLVPVYTNSSLTQDEKTALGKIDTMVTYDGYLVAYAAEKPEVSINFELIGI